MIRTIRPWGIAVLALVGAVAFQATAMPNPIVQQLVEGGGAMQAAAERCDSGYSDARLAELKSQQRGVAAQMGMSAAQFEQTFEAAYRDASARLERLSAQERADACRQLEQAQSR